MKSAVSRTPSASPADTVRYFERRMSLEADCWDVHHAIANGTKDFVLLDVRGEESYHAGHVPTAVNLPHWKINEESLRAYPAETLFVVYCAGTHCNGADKGALAIARLGRPVKLMIGGALGWLDEGFRHDTSPTTQLSHS